jgi:hypothetical protein
MDFIEKVIRREPIWFRKLTMGNLTPTLIRGMAFIENTGQRGWRSSELSLARYLPN